MATVVNASHRTLTAAGGITGATIVGSDGETVGTVIELMIEAGTGRIVYAAVSVGGLMGVGERLFAVPWAAFTLCPDDDRLAVRLTRAEVEQTPGFEKEAWPIEADEQLRGRD